MYMTTFIINKIKTKTQKTRPQNSSKRKKKEENDGEKSYRKNRKKNQNTESHHDFEINHVKITKHSFHNLKY